MVFVSARRRPATARLAMRLQVRRLRRPLFGAESWTSTLVVSEHLQAQDCSAEPRTASRHVRVTAKESDVDETEHVGSPVERRPGGVAEEISAGTLSLESYQKL